MQQRRRSSETSHALGIGKITDKASGGRRRRRKEQSNSTFAWLRWSGGKDRKRIIMILNPTILLYTGLASSVLSTGDIRVRVALLRISV